MLILFFLFSHFISIEVPAAVAAAVAVFKHMAPTMFNLNCFHLQLPFIHRGNRGTGNEEPGARSGEHLIGEKGRRSVRLLIWLLLFSPPGRGGWLFI